MFSSKLTATIRRILLFFAALYDKTIFPKAQAGGSDTNTMKNSRKVAIVTSPTYTSKKLQDLPD
jgi:hypothetical protein